MERPTALDEARLLFELFRQSANGVTQQDNKEYYIFSELRLKDCIDNFLVIYSSSYVGDHALGDKKETGDSDLIKLYGKTS